MTDQQIKDILNKMIQRILAVVHPKSIILFGSAARGEMGSNSDFDLLVIVPNDIHRRKTAQKIYRNLIGVGFASDIVVVTEEDIKQYKDNIGMIIRSALSEGKVVYAS